MFTRCFVRALDGDTVAFVSSTGVGKVPPFWTLILDIRRHRVRNPSEVFTSFPVGFAGPSSYSIATLSHEASKKHIHTLIISTSLPVRLIRPFSSHPTSPCCPFPTLPCVETLRRASVGRLPNNNDHVSLRSCHHCVLAVWPPLPGRIRHSCCQEGHHRCTSTFNVSTPSLLPLMLLTTFCLCGHSCSPPQLGIVGKDCIVLGIEKKALGQMQDPKTVRKMHALDDHINLVFAGLTADARVLVNQYVLTSKHTCSLIYHSTPHSVLSLVRGCLTNFCLLW